MAAHLEDFIEGAHRARGVLTDDAGDHPRLLNRELSWLDFDARVLALADMPSVPLLERAKFLAIFSVEPRRVLPGPRGRAEGPGGAGLGRVSPTGSSRPASSTPSGPGEELIRHVDRIFLGR
jgi:hypothetical protein